MGYPQQPPPPPPPPPWNPPPPGHAQAPVGSPPAAYGTGAPGYGYQFGPAAPQVNKSGSGAKIIVIVAVVLGLLGGGGLLATQLTKKKGSEVTTSTTVFTPTTEDRPQPVPENRTTSSLSSNGPGPTTTGGRRPTTTRQSATTRGGGGAAVEIGGGVSVVPAAGWEVVSQDEGVVVLAGEGGLLRVDIGDVGSASADAVVGQLLQGLEGVLSSMESGQTQSIQPPKANITSAAAAPFRGVLASQQGSQDVGGVAFAFIRQDGLAVAVTVIFDPAQQDQVSQDADEMLGSILTTM